MRTAKIAAVLAAFACPAGPLEASYAPPLGSELPPPGRSYLHETPRSVVPSGPSRAPIPAFSRLYGTGCSTCHAAAPKLNVLGEAFRLAGYRLPENEALIRRDEPVALGAEPWKAQWPRAVWPADLPGLAPVAIRIQTDIRATGAADGSRDLDFRFPHEVYLLAGAPIGDDIAAFVELEWSPDGGARLAQAKVGFQDFLPGLPAGSANLWLGRQDPFLLTFTDRQTDRAGLTTFTWQRFRLADLSLTGPGGSTLRSENALALGGTLPTIEVNGVLGGRLSYGVGVSQGVPTTSDNNDRKDPYYKVRYKFGGLNLRGQYDPGGEPVLGTGGQLQDRALIVEHFGYWGDESTESSPGGSHRANGVSARLLYGPWDAGLGWVRRTFERPYDTPGGDLRGTAWFAKVERFFFPWLLGSLKYDRFDTVVEPAALPAGFGLQPSERRSLVPGAILLIRQNVRAVVESRFYLSGDASRAAGARPPSDLFLRLDLIF